MIGTGRAARFALSRAVDFLQTRSIIRVRQAGVAQLVEQLIRNQQVTRSSRVAGSKTISVRSHSVGNVFVPPVLANSLSYDVSPPSAACGRW